MNSNKFSTRRLALTGVMAAVVFVTSQISFPIPPDNRIHIGNAFCLLSAFILGPVYGGLSAGIGSAFYDLTNVLYIKSIPFTLTFKFLMAFVAGKIAWKEDGARNNKRNIIAAIAGAVTYMFLYISRNFISEVFFSRVALGAAGLNALQRFVTSGINATAAVLISVPLAAAVRKALDRSNIEV